MSGYRIDPVTRDELPLVLPLIASYQRFYGNDSPDPARNARFFAGFLAPSERGLLLRALASDQPEVFGFTCLYWTYSSTRAADVVLLNDLFVRPEHRGQGIGSALIEAAREVATARGAWALKWLTTSKNHTAQRVYDSTGAARSAWIEYELRTGAS